MLEEYGVVEGTLPETVLRLRRLLPFRQQELQTADVALAGRYVEGRPLVVVPVVDVQPEQEEALDGGDVARLGRVEELVRVVLAHLKDGLSWVDLLAVRVDQAVVVVEVELLDEGFGQLDSPHRVAQIIQPGTVDGNAHDIRHHNDHIPADTRLGWQSYLKERIVRWEKEEVVLPERRIARSSRTFHRSTSARGHPYMLGC